LGIIGDSEMRLFLPVLLSACLLAMSGCDNSTESTRSGLAGRIYANAGPGFFEYHAVCTVRAFRPDGSLAAEVPSDTSGAFAIPLAPDSYTLEVRESPDPYPSGPFQVKPGEFATAQAYYYNSMIVRIR